MAEALTTKWYYVEVQKLVPCTHCINSPNAKNRDHTQFVLSDLKMKIEKGEYMVRCKHADADMRMEDLVPDVV